MKISKVLDRAAGIACATVWAPSIVPTIGAQIALAVHLEGKPLGDDYRKKRQVLNLIELWNSSMVLGVIDCALLGYAGHIRQAKRTNQVVEMILEWAIAVGDLSEGTCVEKRFPVVEHFNEFKKDPEFIEFLREYLRAAYGKATTATVPTPKAAWEAGQWGEILRGIAPSV